MVNQLIKDTFAILIFPESEESMGQQLLEVVGTVSLRTHDPLKGLFECIVIGENVGHVIGIVCMLVGHHIFLVLSEEFVGLFYVTFANHHLSLKVQTFQIIGSQDTFSIGLCSVEVIFE